MLTCEHYDFVPDMVVIGKGLGGGIFPPAAIPRLGDRRSDVPSSPEILA